ncbi:MAG TPA: hypothetical protein VK633_03490, partial [Verrucomicrobiae bacterium]|nr:hypothetical protein [Verrucomicrobiae bacterium]
MIPVSLARSLEDLLSRNVLSMRLVRLRFQIAGGTGANLGSANAPFTVSLAGIQVASGQTDANGELTLLIAAGEVQEVNIFDTIYNVSIDAALQPANTRRGQQKRLDVLGYVSGYLRTAVANAVPDDDQDGPRTRQAILNFQTDQ